jgi:alanine racemase
LALRDSGVRGEILVLGEVLDFEYDALFRGHMTPVMHDPARIPALDRQAALRGLTLPFHLKVDSGMGRMGSRADAGTLASAIHAAPHLRCEGLMSHLATTADEVTAQTRAQLDCFEKIASSLASLGVQPRWRHIAASLPLLHGHSEAFQTMVRPGLALYGYPSSYMEPALSWKSRIVMVKQVLPGEPVGYGARWKALRPSLIAVLACGYADGIPHRLDHAAEVLIHGRRAPVRGAVSMDLLTVDVTDCPPARPGDVATIVGSDGAESVNAEDWAAWAGTIPYVILCSVSRRVDRVYVS